MNRRAFLLGSAGFALGGCSTTSGVITPAQVAAWAAQIASYVQVLCGFIPDLTAVEKVIVALYPPSVVVTNIVTTVGNLICGSPTASAATTRFAQRTVRTLRGPMIPNVVHYVTTPNGVIAVPGVM